MRHYKAEKTFECTEKRLCGQIKQTDKALPIEAEIQYVRQQVDENQS